MIEKPENKALTHSSLVTDVRTLIAVVKNKVARTVNAEMTLLYWQIGNRIKADVLNYERAEYGERVLKDLSKTLQSEYGAGFSERNLLNMLNFCEAFPDFHISQTLSAKLTWAPMAVPIAMHVSQLKTVIGSKINKI
jgi:hypothetical protein